MLNCHRYSIEVKWKVTFLPKLVVVKLNQYEFTEEK